MIITEAKNCYLSDSFPRIHCIYLFSAGWFSASLAAHFVRGNTIPDGPLSSSSNQGSVRRPTRYRSNTVNLGSLVGHTLCPFPIAFLSCNQLFARKAWAVKRVQGRSRWYSKQRLKCGQGEENRRTKPSSLAFAWTLFLCVHLK